MEPCHARHLSASLLAGASATVLLACGPAVVDYEIVETPSGRPLKLEAVWPADVEGETALMLVYHTDVDLSDAPALEAEDAWAWLRPRVEADGHAVANIRASQWERPGWQRRERAAEFVIRRTPAGAWRLAGGGS